TERQWCDLAMSLSLLSMCERGFKRLQECWECYSDKLTEPGVYQPLLSITAKLRRGAKPQVKVSESPVQARLVAYFSCVIINGFDLYSCSNNKYLPQAQVDDFEKRLTAVHTRGLENVESPEMDENQRNEGSTEKTSTCTPLPTRGRQKSRRGQNSQP
ncbi:hypothetical protein GOODEAATRI_022364, partial [Goodea atripinnis]